MAAAPRLAGDRRAGDRGSSRRRAGRGAARQGHLRRGAARPAPRRRAPDLSWQTVALGSRAARARRRSRRCWPCRRRARSRCPAATWTPSCSRSPRSAPRSPAPPGARGAWDRGPAEGREDLRAWFAREAGRRPARRRHGRSAPAGRRRCRPRSARWPRPATPCSSSRPTYLGALAAARAAGLRVGAGAGRRRRRAARPPRRRARAAPARASFYCQPLFANPHGATLAVDRRAAVARGRTRRRRVPDRGRLRPRPRHRRRAAAAAGRRRPRRPRRLPALADQVGGARPAGRRDRRPRPGRRPAARGAAASTTCSSPGRCRRRRSSSSPRPAWPRHLRRLRSRAARAPRRARRRAATGTCRSCASPRVPRGGLHLWAALPDGVDDVALAAAAAARGVVVYPGRPGSRPSRPAPLLRLTFAAAPPDALDEGVRRLARALRR